ncbi:hypothetical protein B0H12DRAFT_148644 [Mycena haematopus]|nr:hypothetical protein B0H12DRAFT_148644 [Mycena haematopus]
MEAYSVDSDACPAMPCLISEPTRVPARTGRLHRIGARARLLLPCIDTRQGAKAPAATSTVEATRSDNLTLVSAAPPATPPPCPARASYRARLRPAAPTRPPPPSPAPILSGVRPRRRLRWRPYGHLPLPPLRDAHPHDAAWTDALVTALLADCRREGRRCGRGKAR